MYPGGAPIRRETVCFSWYSPMSMRTIARSSSKRNSAKARASSVLPTPVGPMKMKDPIGRLGSCRPDRDRRTAFDTYWTASSCPTKRMWSRSSIRSNFSISPSISFETGIPVQCETMAATSSASTSSFSSAPSACISFRVFSPSSRRSSSSRNVL